MNMKKALPLLVIASMMLSLIPSAFYASAVVGTTGPTLSVGYGGKGTTIVVTGTGLAAGTTVQIYWDTTTGAWDGVKGLLNSTTVKASGAYTVWFNVPEATNGVHYLWAKDAAGNTGSAPFKVLTKIKSSPSSGLAADTIAGSFYGFSKSTDLTALLAVNTTQTVGSPDPVSGVIEVLSLADGVTKEFKGTLAHKVDVPGTFIVGWDGVQQLHDDGAGNLLNSTATQTYAGHGTINYVTGAYDIVFNTAPAGGGVGIRCDYSYWWTGTGRWSLGTTTTNSIGSASLSWKVPTGVVSPFAYTLVALDGDGVLVANTTFSVGPVATLSPVLGAVGDIIHVTGRGWQTLVAGKAVGMVAPILKENGVTIGPCQIVTTPVVVDLNGRFRMDIVVPGAPNVKDDYTLSFSDNSTALTASADFEVTALQTVKVNPVFGPQGTAITVSGTHYSKHVDTVVTVDLTTTAGALVTNIGTVKTISDGTFSKVFTVPAQVEGQYKIAAYIGAYTTKSTGFRIGSMGIQLSASSGPVGKSLTITGNGFSPNKTWNATIGTTTLVSSGTINAAGLLVGGSVYIPKDLAPGVYTISVLDIDADIMLTAQFTVTYGTSITISPNAAPNAFNVSVTGSGFKYASTGITFTLYNKTSTGAADFIWYADVRQTDTVPAASIPAVVNGTGIVTAYWVVPASAVIGAGNYYLNATDADNYFAQASFQVLAKHVVLTPRKATFGVGDTISFQIENTAKQPTSYIKIYDPSNALVFQGDALATWVKTGLWYTAPYSSQTSSGNPMVLNSDAPLGTWTYKWYDGTSSNNLITSGTFAVAAAAPSPIQQQITDLGTQLTALKDQITGITGQITSIATAATAAQNTATAAQASAAAAKTSADAATTAATAAGTAANAAVTAANAAKTSADNAAAGTSGLTTLVYAAIGASLVAALAAIVALMQISRKIA